MAARGLGLRIQPSFVCSPFLAPLLFSPAPSSRDVRSDRPRPQELSSLAEVNPDREFRGARPRAAAFPERGALGRDGARRTTNIMTIRYHLRRHGNARGLSLWPAAPRSARMTAIHEPSTRLS